jgi:hypothetical protein
MIQAIMLDLPLLTAATDEDIEDFRAYEEQAAITLGCYRDQLMDINRRLSCNPAITVQLRIPLTGRLVDHLHLFWCQQPYSQLRMLRTIVMALLAGRHQVPELITVLDDIQIEHSYELKEVSDSEGRKQPTLTFPQVLSQELCAAWIETLGLCIFACGMTAPHISPHPLVGAWIASDRELLSTVCVTRTLRPSPDQEPEETEVEEAEVAVLVQPNEWTWKRWLRRYIWKDERLPLEPIGFCPPETWQPGQTPRRYQNGYQDNLGGLWEWEGGRAIDDRNPFGGHWNIQFANSSVKHQWVKWIEQCTGWRITTRPTDITYINVEPDGNIGDRTFDWYE